MSQLTPILTTPTTSAKFLALPETMTPTQLIDGDIIVSPSPVPKHQKKIGRLYQLVDRLKPNGEIILAPMDVELDEHNMFQPDIFWVAENGNCIETETGYQGAPDLVIEVLSDSTARFDRGKKFRKYQEHGVREYWIVGEGVLEVWVLQANHLVQHGDYGEGDTFHSPVLNATVELKGIFVI
jgi:Uma2 family endonuclease